MEWKQKVDTNLGITVILVFAALFTIIDFYVVGAHIDGYPFNDFSSNVSDVQENKESFQNGDKVFDLSESDNVKIVNEGQLIYAGGSIDNLYKINDKQFHIIVYNNKVVVDDKDIFSTTDELFKIRLYNDILLIQVKKSSGVDLFFVDMNGNIIKKIENIKQLDIYDSNILYSLEEAGTDGVNMYESSSRNINRITYLGEYNFSDVELGEYYQPGCDTSDYCMIYNKNGLKVEYISEQLEHHKINSHYSLFVNGKNIEIGLHLSNIYLLSDKYLLVSSSFMDGLSKFVSIVDINGNETVDFNDYVLDGEYTSYNLTSGDNLYSNGEIAIYSVTADFDGTENSCLIDNKTAIIGRKRIFKYLGNGKVDNGTIVENFTFGDWALSHCNQ